MSWIPLNVHSQYSILDSTASIQALVERAKSLSIPALGLTDQGNLYGIVDFYKACKAAGIRPILGCEIWMAPVSRLEKKKIVGTPNGFPIILLAKNITGYRNLCKLSSSGFLEGFYYYPRIDREILSQYAEGVICLSGSSDGPLSYRILQGDDKAFLDEISWYRDLFGSDFYLEIQRHPLTEEQIRADGIEENWLLQKARDYVANQEKINQKLI